VPPTVTVPPNSSSVPVPVTSVGQGTTVIHSTSLPAFGDTTATVTVVGAGTINLPAGVSVPLGQSVIFPITLGTPAPAGGLNVALTSTDSTKVAVTTPTVSF